MSRNPKNSKPKLESKHGGTRAGAGRPKGSGKYKEATKAIRVPESSVSQIKDFLASYPTLTAVNTASGLNSEPLIQASTKLDKLAIPLYSSKVAAGKPSPAEDHIDETVDLNDYMVRRPDTTFMLRVEGESMKNAGILPNDILVVDRSLIATHNKIVIAALDGELTVKRLLHQQGVIKLLPENPNFPEIELESETDLHIWGVVIGSFRRFQTF